MESCTYMYILWLVLKLVSGFIMPMTNSGGDPDIASIVNHVTLLEQTMRMQTSQIATLTTKLETTGSDMKIMKDKVNILESQLSSTNTKLQKAVFHIDFLTSGITTKLATVEEKMVYVHSNLSQRIDLTGKDVGFQVSQSATKSGWTTLSFDTVDYNLGGGYNPTSGYFTAPVAGTYVIWMHILIRESRGDIHMYKNSKIIANGNGDSMLSGVYYSTGSATTVVHLNIGDTIHLVASTYSVVNIYGGKYSHFGGALIHASSVTI